MEEHDHDHDHNHTVVAGSASVSGCKNNGVCGTGGCNKLSVHDWLSDIPLPSGAPQFDVVEVRFKGSRKEFYRCPEHIRVKVGEAVAVEANPGHDIGIVSATGPIVKLQLKKKHIEPDSTEIKSVYRLAKPADIEKWEEGKKLEESTKIRSRIITEQLKLTMKLSDVEYQGDQKKATFFYTAEDRVDFRELIKKLAEEFKVRIEMRQIGTRQEASRVGGIGDCGRELCCSTWLTDFKTVTTGSARYQNLSLNPVKLAGQCGKLKCCLNYELDSYLDALKDFPDSNTVLKTKKGNAVQMKSDIFKRLLWYGYKEMRREPGEEGGGASGQWVPIPVDRVKEIIQMNLQGIFPPDFNEFVEEAPPLPSLGYLDVVGQDSITRMDQKKSKHKKRNRKNRPPRDNRPAENKPKPA